jgi:hypothetical protein
MWNTKTNVMPVKIGVTGTISKLFRKYLTSITGEHEIKGLQKTETLGTAHIRWEVKGKAKAFPLQAWRGPWGSRRLRLQNF